MEESEKETEHRRLTRSIGTNETCHSCRYRQMKVAESYDLSVVVGQSLDFDDVVLTHSSVSVARPRAVQESGITPRCPR